MDVIPERPVYFAEVVGRYRVNLIRLAEPRDGEVAIQPDSLVALEFA